MWRSVNIVILLELVFLAAGEVFFEYRLLYYQNERSLYRDSSNSTHCCNNPKVNTSCTEACIPSIEITLMAPNGIFCNDTLEKVCDQKWFSFRNSSGYHRPQRIIGWNKEHSSLNILVYEWNNRSNVILNHTTARSVEPSLPSDGIITHTEIIDDRNTSAKLIFSWILYSGNQSNASTCKNTTHGVCNSDGYLICNDNYYGQNCTKFCNVVGHGSCDQYGSVKCNAGYYGTNCLRYCKNVTNSVCLSNGTRICNDGFFGPDCSLTCSGGLKESQLYCNGSGYTCSDKHYGLDCSVHCIHIPVTDTEASCKIDTNGFVQGVNRFITIVVTACDNDLNLAKGAYNYSLDKSTITVRGTRFSRFLTNVNDINNRTKVTYLQNWTSADYLNINVRHNNQTEILALIPTNTIPDNDMNVLHPTTNYLQSLGMFFKAWIFYTKVGSSTTINKTCDATYYGQECSRRCPAIEEQFHGECTSTQGWRCDPGWTGENCLEDINECDNYACKHGQCVNIVGGYYCRCIAGWTGYNCTLNVNECKNKSICSKGTCNDTEGSYTCVCENGWTGINCDKISRSAFQSIESNILSTTASSLDVKSVETTNVYIDVDLTSSTQLETNLFFTRIETLNVTHSNVVSPTSTIFHSQSLGSTTTNHAEKTDLRLNVSKIYGSLESIHLLLQSSETKHNSLHYSGNPSTDMTPSLSSDHLTKVVTASVVSVEQSPSSTNSPKLPIQHTSTKNLVPKEYDTTSLTTRILPTSQELSWSTETFTTTQSTLVGQNIVSTTHVTRLSTGKKMNEESTTKSWIKENMVLALGISIGVAVVLVIIVIVLVVRKRSSMSKSSHTDPIYQDIFKDKRKLTLILNTDDELIPMDEAGIPKHGSLYSDHQPNKSHGNPLYEESGEHNSHAC